MANRSNINFNSIKVQLEPISGSTDLDVHKFQFHKGTIRTSELAFEIRAYIYFNSIKVQLELPLICMRWKLEAISIP